MPVRMKGHKPEPAEITFRGMNFLITDRPNDVNIDRYVEVSHVSMPTNVSRLLPSTL